MWDKTSWMLSQLMRKVWVRSVSYAVVGVATALLASLLSPYIPVVLVGRIGSEAVEQVLGILASSMLAVATFSLSIAVSAFTAAAATATPRATSLLQEDRTTQNVIATFIGAFLFGLVGTIALQTGLYDDRGRLVLFLVTIGVVVLVVLAFLRWVSHLMTFGRLNDTLDRVEAAAMSALKARAKMPCLGAYPMSAPPPADAEVIVAESTGYIQHVDASYIDGVAADNDATVWLEAVPGSFVYPGARLLSWTSEKDERPDMAELKKAFTCGAARNFSQDPRFGLIVLSEIASRALSPAVNDPGTAIDVIGRLVRLLAAWQPAEDEPRYRRLFVAPITAQEMVTDAFQPIARDGAGIIEVQVRLQKAYAALHVCNELLFAEAAIGGSREAVERARKALMLRSEVDLVEALAAELASENNKGGRVDDGRPL